MSNIVVRKPEGKLIRALAPQVGRSSLTFVALSAIVYWVMLQGTVPFTLMKVTIFSLSMVLASVLTRFGFRQTNRIKDDSVRFALQTVYVLVVIAFGLTFAYRMSWFLADGLWDYFDVDLSCAAFFGTVLFDSIYNFVLDGLSQSKNEPGDGNKKIGSKS